MFYFDRGSCRIFICVSKRMMRLVFLLRCMFSLIIDWPSEFFDFRVYLCSLSIIVFWHCIGWRMKKLISVCIRAVLKNKFNLWPALWILHELHLLCIRAVLKDLTVYNPKLFLSTFMLSDRVMLLPSGRSKFWTKYFFWEEDG